MRLKKANRSRSIIYIFSINHSNYENVFWPKSLFALNKKDCIAFFELPENQLGGSIKQADGSYKNKYLKYKNKYLELKRNIN